MKHAWWMLALLIGCDGAESTGMACGDTTSTGGSGGSTGTLAGPMETVLVVDDYGDPLGSVPVVVNDEVGSVVHVDHTAADGTVSVDVPKGGCVSIFQADTVWLRQRTVVSPPDGSTIRFPVEAPRERKASEAETTIYEVTFTSIPMEAFYVWVKLDGSCAGNGAWPDQPTTTLTDNNCAASLTHRIIAFAVNEELKSVGWGEATVSAIPAGTVNVNLALTEKTVASTEVEIIGIPSVASFADMSVYAIDGGTLGQGVHEKAPLSWQESALVTFPNIPDLERRLSAGVTIDTELASSAVYRSERFSAATQPASWQFKVDSVAWVLTGPADTSSAEHPLFAWSTTGPEEADYIQLSSGWSVGVGGVDYRVVLPPEHVTSWRMPDVPDELSSFRPHPASVMGTVDVRYVESDAIDGYPDVLDGLPKDYSYAIGTTRSARTIAPQ